MRTSSGKNNLPPKTKKTILFLMVLVIPARSFYWEDGIIDLGFYTLNPGFKPDYCSPFFDDNHF